MSVHDNKNSNKSRFAIEVDRNKITLTAVNED